MNDPKKREAYSIQIAEGYLKYLKNCNSVLDVGSYEGYLVKLLRKKKVNAVGVDIRHSNNFVMKADARKLPFKKNSFDCVIMSHLIEHLQFQDLIKILSECFRVIKQNGTLIIATPIVREIWDDCSHVRPYTFRAIKQLLEQPNYVGGSWNFKIIKKEWRIRANEILRGIFYKLHLFNFYRQFIVPIQNLLGWGNKEIIVIAKAQK